MGQRSVFVIEDDDAIRQGVVDALTFCGYKVMETADGPEGLKRALRAEYDLLLLDLGLPGLDGLEILQEVRGARPTLPIIILTARGAETDRVKGLQLGADDYVVKPFSVKELTARVEAVLRRSPDRPTDVKTLTLPCGEVDFQARTIRYPGGDLAELSERETDLLRYLARHPGRAVSREELLARVWRIDTAGVTTRTIDMHVARLREKLQDGGPEHAIIRTVRGKGYAFHAVADGPAATESG